MEKIDKLDTHCVSHKHLDYVPPNEKVYRVLINDAQWCRLVKETESSQLRVEVWLLC